MEEANQTEVTEFILMGFSASPELQWILFVMFLIIYLLTIVTNTSIIAIVRSCPSLHCPMYVLLSNLSFLEIWYTSVMVPKMLAGLLSISYAGCITQLYFLITLGTAECFILAIMAYDRYLAICNPLRYPILMNNRVCVRLAICSWVGAFIVNVPPLVSLCKLPFCGPNEINHFFCDAPPLLKLSCRDPREAETVNFIVATSVIVSSFLLIVVSYILIIVTILKIPSALGRRKAFSTCGCHLAVVAIFYGTLMFMYVRPTSSYSNDSVNFNKLVSMFYTVVTPMLNPIIYCLRNKEVKESLRKAVMGRCVLLPKAGSISNRGR
uniref:Olfactory receptor n=1 Tax=Chelydra serpentina TaxID=8475 RepID=A0A8C3XSB1_CHESE